MPWYKEPMKDVVDCDKSRIAVNKRFNPGISEWGNPLRYGTAQYAEHISIFYEASRRIETSK